MELLEAAGKGDFQRVEQLVSAGADIEATDDQDRTALIWAADNGHLDVARFLVGHGAAMDVSDSYGRTPLTRAARDGHLNAVRFLVEHGAALDASDSEGRTPLMAAAHHGHLDIVYALIERGAAVDASDSYGRTPLTWAARGGHLDVVCFLVEHGVTVDARDSYGRTPLTQAARDGRLDMVRFLVEHGAALDASDSDGWAPLTQAARDGRLDMVRFLVERGSAVDARESDGSTPLMRAAENGHLDVVRFLVERGAAVDAREGDVRTPLAWAARDGHLDVMRFLVEYGAAVDVRSDDGSTSLLRAARDGYLDVVRFLVDNGANVDVSSNDGSTPLMQAAFDGQLEVVRFLVESGAAMDVRCNDGRTPLLQAAENGHLDVVCLLVERGAAVDTRGNGRETPLARAAENGHLDVVHYLVDHGAAVNTNTGDGSTPLMRAVCDGHLDMVRVLIERGAALDANSNNGSTPLMWAISGGHLDMVRFLVERGAALDASDSDGSTPLTRAARDGHLDMVRFLVGHGAAVDTRESDGSTPILLAVIGQHLDMVRSLVEHGAAVDARTNLGWTPLMRAAENGHLDMVQFLVKHGADANLKSTTGDTAISIATKFGRQNVVQFLLPLVRYQDRRTQTQNADEHVAQQANIPSSWLIPPFEVEVEPFINGGNIGGDYRGKWLDADVVVKLFVHDASSATFADEVRLWHQLRHPNILKLYGVCNSHHHLFVCEYASNGSLPEYLNSREGEHQTPWKFLHEAALGLEYLHERKIVHGNLRGSSILIGSDGLAKLSGFTLSVSSSEGRWYASGDRVRWAAPESLKGEQVSLASDVYSLGMCIIEAASGKVPFSNYSEDVVERDKESILSRYMIWSRQGLKLTNAQAELVVAMCPNDPNERLQIPAVVSKLEEYARMEATTVSQLSEPESLVAFDEFDRGRMSSLWSEVQTLVDQSKNAVYRQIHHNLALIYDTLRAESHPWSTLQRFHDLLAECQLALDTMSQQNRVYRLSATRARDYSVQGLHRRIAQLLQLVRPQDQDAEKRETEWKHLCREQVEVFVSEASEACVMLSSVDSEEDRSALVAVLRAELRNSDGKYTGKQLAVLQETCDEIVSKSLEDVHLATTPEWFIPWFELEMNEMATLGEGGFGRVFKAKWLDSEVVVKKLEIDPKDAANSGKKREMRQMFEREVDIWFGLSHPHVVRLFGACHVGRPFFVCELAPNGTLVEYLRNHPDEIWVKFREAAMGVQYLHARSIVHGDLKGNNILIGSDGKAKVTDFGLSGVFGDDSTEVVVSGAWHWVAPECMMKQKPTFASDIYSLAMCIIEALRVTNGDENDLPWGALPNAAVKFNVTRRHRLPPRPQNCSDEVWTLIECMCKSDPVDRMLIMTVVDELEKFAVQQGNLSDETNQIASGIAKMRLSSSSVANTLTKMKNWIAKCDARSNWERGVLKNIYQLLWDRLDQVATQLLSAGEDIVGTKMTTSDFSILVERSQERTRKALGITGGIPLGKFTELALGGYALHRRLDKLLAAHAVLQGSSPLHDWTSTCSTFMGVSYSLIPARNEEDCSVDEIAEEGAIIVPSTENAKA